MSSVISNSRLCGKKKIILDEFSLASLSSLSLRAKVLCTDYALLFSSKNCPCFIGCPMLPLGLWTQLFCVIVSFFDVTINISQCNKVMETSPFSLLRQLRPGFAFILRNSAFLQRAFTLAHSWTIVSFLGIDNFLHFSQTGIDRSWIGAVAKHFV